MSTEAETRAETQADPTNGSEKISQACEDQSGEANSGKETCATKSGEDLVVDDSGPPRVLVTGASGYLATHIVNQLLQQGRLRVRGTVRDLNREDKIKPLKELVPDALHPLELVEAELTNEESWKEAIRGCTYVLHVASPIVVKTPKDPNVLIGPAVDGTLNVLKACVAAGTVKRVVLTSSIAAVAGGICPKGAFEADKIFSEKDWPTDQQCQGPYELSKFKAERAAWDFIDGLKDEEKFELVVINPGVVIGPFLSAASGAVSGGVVELLLKNKLPSVPNVAFPIIDVREVALAQIAALERPDASGGRYVIVNKTLWFSEIAAIVSDHFKPQGYKIPTKTMKKFMLNMMGVINSEAKVLAKAQGKKCIFSNDKMRGELGVEPRAESETIIDMCYSLIELGRVNKTSKYLGHPNNRPKDEPKSTENEGVKSEPKAEMKTVEEPKAEEQTEEEPKVEEKTEEEPKVEEKTEEEPKAEEISEEEPKAEEKTEEPETEEISEEEPKTTSDISEEAKEKTEEEHKTEEISEDEPKTEEISEEEPKAKEISEEEPKTEEISEEPKTEEISEEEPKTEEISEEEPKTEEISEEEPKTEEISEEEPKTEEISEEEPKTEETSLPVE